MKGYKHVFRRVEQKYILGEFQYCALMKELLKTASVDAYGRTTILNLYYDTPDFRLIRTSIDGCIYKEKLRLRSYGIPDSRTDTFLEIEKKYDGVVYKRRMDLPYAEALRFLRSQEQDRHSGNQEKSPAEIPMKFMSQDSRAFLIPKEASPLKPQIQKEIEYFFERYPGLSPAMVISYERIALAGRTDPEFWVTFDSGIRWRTENMGLSRGDAGLELLEPGQHLMELKISGTIDKNLSVQLSRLGIFRTGFSKYGRAYLAYKEMKNNHLALRGGNSWTFSKPLYLHQA